MNAFDFAEQILSTPLITDSATLKKAQQGVMDYFAVSLQARHQKVLQDFKAWINREGGKPVAWLIGQKAEATVRQAALFNGFQAHLLDYDDVHSDVRGHPSAVILSALFASLSSEKSSLVNSQRFLTAYIIGVEVMARLGKAVNPAHYLKGWHSTATLGGIAATCAICYLYKKDSLAQAIALAATQASGMRMVFGSPIKALHAGMTAQSAIQAVEWLEAGLSLDQNAFDENIGFFALLARKILLKLCLKNGAKIGKSISSGLKLIPIAQQLRALRMQLISLEKNWMTLMRLSKFCSFFTQMQMQH